MTCFKAIGSQGTDISLYLIGIILHIISIICLTFIGQQLCYFKVSSTIFIIILLCLCRLFPFLLSFYDKISDSAWIPLIILFPFAGFSYFNALILQAKTSGFSLSWNYISYKLNTISTLEVLICMFANTILYIILTILLTLIISPLYGTPLIYWRKFFKKEQWKRLFKKEENNFHKYNEVIRFEHISKYYGKTKALDDVSLYINSGEVIVTIGSNGSGKSTLINSLIGTFPTTKGTIYFCNEPINNDFSLIYRNLGIVFQDNIIIKEFTVYEMLKLFDSLTGKDENEIEKDIQYYSSTLELNECLNNKADKISGGQKRKLQLILALLKSPKLLIFDELTTGVDVQSKQFIQKILDNFKDSTILMTTHSFEESEMLASRIVVMQKGHISFCGTAVDMRNEYNCGYNITIIDGEPNMEGVLNVIRSIVPEATFSRNNMLTIFIPNDLRVADVLEKLESMKNELGFENYTILIESLEEIMQKIIEKDDLDIEFKNNQNSE